MFCLYGLHDCNSVHYQRGLTSIVLRCCLHYSRLIMISYSDTTLVGELLSISVYTVYAITFDGSCLTHFMKTTTLILYNQLMSRESMLSTKQLMMLSTCHSVCIQLQACDLSWLQWAATVWMHVMLSLKDSRCIYSFFLHFERSATFGTVGCSKVFYGNTQWNFRLCWFCLNLILFVLIPACGDVSLCFDVCNEGGNDTWKRWDCDESSKCKRTLLSSNSRLCLHDWGWVLSDCEWVLKSQKVYIIWCRWLHKYFFWQWHSCFAFLWPQDRNWHFPGWPCFSSLNDFVISFVE
jgi:hypothetical protein